MQNDKKKEFYQKLSKQENYSFRELDRQISSSLYERAVLGNVKLSTTLREIHPEALNTFKDSYVFDFFKSFRDHNDGDLQKGQIKTNEKFYSGIGQIFFICR